MGRKFIAAGIDNAPTTDFNPFNADQILAAAIAVLFSNPRERPSRSPR